MSPGLNEIHIQKNEEKRKKVERLWSEIELLEFKVLGVDSGF